MHRFLTDDISIASYSFHQLLADGQMDSYGYLESLRYRYHLTTADIWNGFIREADEADLKNIRRAMNERGITLANLCCDWAHPWDEDPDQLAANNHMAERMLRAAEILGAASVRFDVGVREDEINDEQFDYVAAKFAQYAAFGHNAGFAVGPENHWGASRRLSLQRRLHEAINSPAYGMLLHLGNWQLEDGRSADETDRLAAPLAVHTHVSYEMAMRADEVLPPLRAAGYKGVFSCEFHRGVHAYEGVAAHVGLMRYALAKMRDSAATPDA